MLYKIFSGCAIDLAGSWKMVQKKLISYFFIMTDRHFAVENVALLFQCFPVYHALEKGDLLPGIVGNCDRVRGNFRI